jgi:hypothetical protein
MYIEFDIMAAPVGFDELEKSVKDWAQKYQVPYTTKVAKGLKYRLGLNYPEHFTLFFVTWNGSPYQVKTPKNIDTSIPLRIKSKGFKLESVGDLIVNQYIKYSRD